MLSDVETELHLPMSMSKFIGPSALDLKVLSMKSKGNLQKSVRRSRDSIDSTFGEMDVGPGDSVQFKKSLLIPNNKETWMVYMCELMRSRVCLQYLSDKEIERVISRAKKTMCRKPGSQVEEIDPDLPVCYSWDEKQISAWCIEEALPLFQACIKSNHITGRKLVKINASALVKMGIRDLNEIKKITAKIRELLHIPRPNIMRALARRVPYELYLHKKSQTGRDADSLTFEKFCENEGFPYRYLMRRPHKNPTAKIPGACKVLIYPFGDPNILLSPPSTDRSSDENSLCDAPTVEFVAREVLVHNQIVQQIIDALLTCICADPEDQSQSCRRTRSRASKSGNSKKAISTILEEGYDALGLGSDALSKERLEFATKVAHSLVEEMMRTADVLNDIEDAQNYLKKSVTAEELEVMRCVVHSFSEEVYPLCSLLRIGSLSLESIFKQEPEFEEYVDDIIVEAEKEVSGSGSSEFSRDENFIPLSGPGGSVKFLVGEDSYSNSNRGSITSIQEFY